MSDTFWLDISGTILSLTCTILFIRAHRAAWFFDILAIIINMTLYIKKALFGKVFLDIFYLITIIYGWKKWSPVSTVEPPIEALSYKQKKQYFVLTLLSIFILTPLFHFFTPSNIPYIDATTLTLGLIAHWLLCRRTIDCWYYFLIMDIITTYIQWERDIPFHAGLHVFYCFLAIGGILRWRAIRRNTFYSLKMQVD